MRQQEIRLFAWELFCSNRVWIIGSFVTGGRLMSTMQAFFLGMMMAWTPSLLILAFALWDVPFSSEPDQVERPEQGPA